MANPAWVKGGTSPNPSGRPPKAREMARLAILHEIVGAQEHRQIWQRALYDALGYRPILQDNKVIGVERDPDSTASGRKAARADILAYSVGLPAQRINLNDTEGDVFEQFSNLSEEQIVAILSELERVQSALGIAGDVGSGTGAAGEGDNLATRTDKSSASSSV